MHDYKFFISRYLKNCLDSNEWNHQSAALIKLNILLSVDANFPYSVYLFSHAQEKCMFLQLPVDDSLCRIE